ncbi:hypothetical protein PGPR2_01310 [Pseudomonas aeruginosa PGPR2]|nr:hypothetical protein PGPR2_01310 [Pseudomonas aeruginosa PGPR2]
MLTMPSQIVAVTWLELTQAKSGREVKRLSAGRIQITAKQDEPILIETDEALIEGQVEVRSQQKAVERIQPLTRAGSAPRLYVRSA